MKKSYFPKDGIWLKGNTHTHSTKSDGQITPEALVEAYKAHGYDFLSLTDHNMLLVHDYIPDVIMITGTEHDLEYNPNKCIHVVGLAAEGRATTQYPCRRYSAQELTDQQLIDMMRDDGQFVSIAHPVWSRMEPEELLKLEGYHGTRSTTMARSICATAATRSSCGTFCCAMASVFWPPVVTMSTWRKTGSAAGSA